MIQFYTSQAHKARAAAFLEHKQDYESWIAVAI